MAAGAKEYVRITLPPKDGQKRGKAIWARVIRRTSTRVTYLEVSRDGEEERDLGTNADSVPVEQKHMIVACPGDLCEQPARMNLTYAELEVVKS